MPIKHYFIFEDPQYGTVQIGEPDGFDKNGFTVKQHSDGYGRDITFAGGKSGFRIWSKSEVEYEFDKVLAIWLIKGCNGVVKYRIDFDDTTYIIGQMDMADTFATDLVRTIDFNVIENTITDLFKKRFDTNINQFATKTLNDLDIQPVTKHKMLYRAVPSVKRSIWNTPSPESDIGAIMLRLPGFPTSITNTGINYAFGIKEYGIKNTLNFIAPRTALTSGVPNLETFTYLQAEDELTDLVITIKNIDIDVYNTIIGDEDDIINPNAYSRLVLRYGDTLQTSTLIVLEEFGWKKPIKFFKFQETFTVNIAKLDRGKKVWIYIENRISGDIANGSSPLTRYFINVDFNNMDVEATATSTPYSTVIRAARIYDVMKYSALSAGNNPIDAPRWATGGELYNQFFSTSNMMGRFDDKPFNITNKFISDKYLPEVNGDYELQKDGKVFYGIYRDFYRNVECGVFDLAQDPVTFEAFDFKASVNPLYACNQLTAKFDNFQSQKETEKDNTNDIVHGQTEWLYPNPGAQNKKEIAIGVVRDPFLTDEMRIKAYSNTDNSATQDDSKVVAIDAIPLQEVYPISTSTFLQHSVVNGKLVLANQGEITWELLGIEPGGQFFIFPGNVNGGLIFTVESFTDNAITLLPTIPVNNLASSDGVSTRYRYEAVAEYINRTDEGFDLITGLSNTTQFGNLNWTIKHILLNYYNEYNASNTLHSGGKPIKNTLYNNNPELTTQFEGGEIINEGESFTATGAILSTMLVDCTIVCSLKEWLDMQEKIRTDRGFIRIMRSDGIPMKVYLKQGEFLAETASVYGESNYYGSAKIVAEVRYEPGVINIIGVRGDITINDQITPSGYTFKIDNIGKLSIFDATGRRIHVPVLYNNVSVNGSIPVDESQLGQWMADLTPEWDGI